MAYLNAYLGVCPGYGWQGGPVFNTRIIQLQNGRERRNANWAQPKHRYTAPFLNISRQAFLEIKRMFFLCQGQLHAFRFRDALDFEAIDEPFATGDGTTVEFQLAKMSEEDGIQYLRNVYALAGTPTVEVNGTIASATFDMDRGKVVFDSAPANGAILTWSGEFDVWVRFDQDEIAASLDNPNATNLSVTLIEVAPPPEGS